VRRGLLLAGALVVGASACAGGSAPLAEAEPPPRVESQLCVVRHAQAYKNLEPRPPGLSAAELDSLTPAGEAEARALADALPPGVALVWSSPTQRSLATAALLGVGEPVVADELGPLAGAMSLEQRLGVWAAGEDPRPVDGGESLADGAARVQTMLARLRAELRPGSHAVVVTHGDIAPVILGELDQTPLLDRPQIHALPGGRVRCVALTAPG
jgi:broad specificity phosphatase PhoE